MVTRFGDALWRIAFPALMATKALLAPVAFGAHALIVDRDGKVLLARHSYKGGWSLPGGGVARGEPAEAAMLREMKEELGGVTSKPPVFVGLYTRKAGWATNVIALYRLDDAEVNFKPNREVREIMFCDPAAPPPGTAGGTRRRLAEHLGKTPVAPYW